MKTWLRTIMAQRNIGKQWGVIAQVAGQASIFVTMISLCLIAVTAYNTTLSGWLIQRGIHIGFWVFAIVLLVFLVVPTVLIWKFALPSYFSSMNEQVYQHDNPIKKDIEKLSKDNAEIKRLLKEVINRQTRE